MLTELFPRPWIPIVGFSWTIFLIYLLVTAKGKQLLSNPRLIVFWIAALGLALNRVLSEIAEIETLAGGLRILDAHIGYGRDHIRQFAEALDEKGRVAYAIFQLGADTLAPPGFASLMASVSHSTLKNQTILKFCKTTIWLYLISVLLANALMPVIMLNYPTTDTFFLQFLWYAVPFLDSAKYGLHFTTWILIFTGWVLSRTKLK